MADVDAKVDANANEVVAGEVLQYFSSSPPSTCSNFAERWKLNRGTLGLGSVSSCTWLSSCQSNSLTSTLNTLSPGHSAKMAQTQAAIADTIAAMKLAMKRKADDSGSDTNATSRTNRGNKLKRRARHAQQHRLDDTGALAWRQRINHAGYMRNTISTNPKRYDKYGYVYSPAASDDEDLDEDAEIEAVEDNPFGEVALENLLRPLNSAADLAEHPSLRVAYESKALTQMADEAAETLRREKASLYKAKRLLRRFRGDGDWVPCEVFETDHDEFLLGGVGSAVPSIATGQPPHLELEVPAVGQSLDEDLDPTKGMSEENSRQEAEAMEGVETADQAAPRAVEERSAAENDAIQQDPVPETTDPTNNGDTAEPPTAEDTTTTDDPPQNPTLTDLAEASTANSETASNSATTERHAMTTRARARSPAERTPSPSPSDSASVPEIHPWFIVPSSALIDRDLGLPASEAEDTRKLLLLYVQKQEQICRSLEELCSGLQKADRLRKFVYRAAKAEGHTAQDGKGNVVTEMSDGEDWYDVRDWGMEEWEVLEKGKDEVEDVEEERRGRPGRGRRVNRI